MMRGLGMEVASYPYQDEAGETLSECVRYEPKDFRQRRSDGNGGYLYNLAGVRRVLYRLPLILKAIGDSEPVYLVEGEKDVHALEAVGIVATCNPMGAGKWRPEYSEVLRGSQVTIVADQDDAGRDHARAVALALRGIAASVRIRSPREGKDVSDHLAAGFGVADLIPGLGEDRPDTALPFASVTSIAERVALRGRRKWLARPVIRSGEYGVLGGEDKSGKTWAVLDLAVSVATGTPWLGYFAVEDPGPVVVFHGEGDEAEALKRLDAILFSRGLTRDHVSDTLRICSKSPELRNEDHLDELALELLVNPARLVIIDPFYLAARGSRGSDLYEMGSTLYEIQSVCQDAGAALVLAQHWNKTGEGHGAHRFTGVGPGAWGRFLGSAAVEHRSVDDSGGSDVSILWEWRGGGIADIAYRMRRKVRALNEDDPDCALSYSVEVQPAVLGYTVSGLSPGQSRVLDALTALCEETGSAQSVASIQDRVANDDRGMPLKSVTVQKFLPELERLSKVHGTEGGLGMPRFWSPIVQGQGVEVAV